jgi:hypothetical protein
VEGWESKKITCFLKLEEEIMYNTPIILGEFIFNVCIPLS